MGAFNPKHEAFLKKGKGACEITHPSTKLALNILVHVALISLMWRHWPERLNNQPNIVQRGFELGQDTPIVSALNLYAGPPCCGVGVKAGIHRSRRLEPQERSHFFVLFLHINHVGGEPDFLRCPVSPGSCRCLVSSLQPSLLYHYTQMVTIKMACHVASLSSLKNFLCMCVCEHITSSYINDSYI